MIEKTVEIPESILKAQNIKYDNTNSGLAATDIQAAIDEIKETAGTGTGEGSGDENVIESISVNGTTLTPDANKNVDITIPEGYDDTTLAGRVTDLETGMADKADKTELHSHDNKATLDGVTDAKVAEWDAKATEAFVTNAIAQAQLDGSEVDLSGLATKDELAAKADSTHTHTLADVTDYEAPDLSGYAKTEDIPDVSNFVEKEEGKGLFSGSYNDLTDKPEIPTTDGLVTEEALSTALGDYTKTEDLPSSYDDTALVERVGNVETALAGKADTDDIPDVSNFVEKEEGKGLFSGSYNDLTDKPTIPSTDGFVSTESLNTTLADYAKTEDIPDEYDDTAISDRVKTIEDDYLKTADKTELTEAIATAKQEAIDTVLGENVDADFDTLQEVAAWIQSDTTGSTELINRVSAVETNLGGHTVKSDVPENAKFTDTTDFLPLAGGTMNKNSSITIPSANLAGGITLKDDTGYTATLTSDCLHIVDEESNTTTIGASAIYSPKFVGDLTGKVNGYTIGASVPANAKFTDTTNFLPLAGGTMALNSGINLPADGGISSVIQLNSTDGYATNIYPAEITTPLLRTKNIVANDTTLPIGSASTNVKIAGKIVDGSGVEIVQSGWSEGYDISRASSADGLFNDNLNYWYVKYNSGVMILCMTHALQGPTSYHTIYLPISFANNQYAVIFQDNNDSSLLNGVRLIFQWPGYFSFNTQSQGYRSDDYAEGVDTISILCIGRWK